MPGLLVLMLQPLLTQTVSVLAARGHKTTVVSRIQIGLVSGIVAYLVMIGAALLQGQRQAAVSPWWLFGCFVALTLGELLVYPLSMALVTRLAPTSGAASAMGLWMAAVAIGQWLAGEVAARWAVWSHMGLFSALVAISLAAVGVLALSSGAITIAVDRAGEDTKLHR